MFTKKFVTDAAERAISTVAQFLLVLGGADGANFLNFTFEQLLTLSLLGGLASVLKSLVATKTGDSQSASLVGTEIGQR